MKFQFISDPFVSSCSVDETCLSTFLHVARFPAEAEATCSITADSAALLISWDEGAGTRNRSLTWESGPTDELSLTNQQPALRQSTNQRPGRNLCPLVPGCVCLGEGHFCNSCRVWVWSAAVCTAVLQCITDCSTQRRCGRRINHLCAVALCPVSSVADLVTITTWRTSGRELGQSLQILLTLAPATDRHPSYRGLQAH